MSVDGVTQVLVVLEADDEIDAETHERLAHRLRAEIADLDVEAVTAAPAAAAPANAKGDPVTIGALVVALSASGGVFTALIETARDWLGRQHGRHRISVTVDGDTIELERASSAQQRELIDAFLQRHRTE
ncbi:hypothetical protein OHA21_17285 [Actinoplanes sp. NBC_00393]|uniref:effector-associated constant component EACC1 n=1 Tax=Actinoplanes sp. NBC_00393 TaxID=2975953 RepID=UPI002E1C37C3